MVLGTAKPSEFDTSASQLLSLPHKTIDGIHALTWVARLSMSAGVAVPKDFLDDGVGILHTYVHFRISRQAEFTQAWALAFGCLMKIECLIPGYLP